VLFVLKKQATPTRTPSPAPGPTPDRRRIQTRRSGVHGKGVFAVQPLAEGERLIEYVGEVINWKEALRRHPHDPTDPNHTFYFHIDEDHVIDAKVGGNSSRWINHSCKPNCEADEERGRVFIKALRNIKPGEELFYDYGLIIDARYTPKLLAEYPCWCGARKCRGTLLAPKEKPKKSEKKALKKAAGQAAIKASLAAEEKSSGKKKTRKAEKPIRRSSIAGKTEKASAGIDPR
jgi:uncharacterized protein